MRNYLDNRQDYILNRRAQSFNNLSLFNSREIIGSLVFQAESIKEEIENSLGFLLSEKENVYNAEIALDKIESRLSSIEDSIDYILYVRKEFIHKNMIDMAFVNLSKGVFENTNYSVVDRGIILEEENPIKIV